MSAGEREMGRDGGQMLEFVCVDRFAQQEEASLYLRVTNLGGPFWVSSQPSLVTQAHQAMNVKSHRCLMRSYQSRRIRKVLKGPK